MMTAANDNNQRPAEFDAALNQWRKFMLKLANRLDPSNAEDLLHDTIEVCLRRWASYDKSKRFTGWLAFQMKSTHHDNLRRTRTLKATPRFVQQHPVVEPNQEHYVDVSRVSASLAGRDGDVVIRLALGESGEEVGKRFGISRERVRQIANAERLRLREAA